MLELIIASLAASIRFDTRHASDPDEEFEKAWEILNKRAQDLFQPKKRAKSVANDLSMLNGIIIPALGSRLVSEVSHRDIQACITKCAGPPRGLGGLFSRLFTLSGPFIRVWVKGLRTS